MKKIALAAAAVSMMFTGAASAADMAPRYAKAPPPVVAVWNWTGFYIGAHAGWTESESRYDFATAGHYNLVAGDSFRYNTSGFMGGGHAGYNWQTGQFVLGIEGSISYTDLNRTVISPYFPASDTFRTRQEWIATVTPRLGIASGQWLFYVKGGVAFSEINTRIQDNFDYNQRNDTRVGWTVGGGVEWMATQNWILGVEGNYYDFGRCCGGLSQSALLATNAPAGVFSNHSTYVDNWSVLGRVSYKFGGPLVARY
ncbi:outer membrane protein [Bradyrhizobium sp.]|uniref:outer membrane protein n=1 Tax=Bradyrhizobium sp. TaxID=376 RepID=UPI00272EFC8A|nr:outer membrane protein [Bradyrhizobium sp.]MDP1869487.1 porin family protein [Bradyrhizobium sp.]MDP3075048.1 porin family protein [Bradyrhizobium sp.]